MVFRKKLKVLKTDFAYGIITFIKLIFRMRMHWRRKQVYCVFLCMRPNKKEENL